MKGNLIFFAVLPFLVACGASSSGKDVVNEVPLVPANASKLVYTLTQKLDLNERGEIYLLDDGRLSVQDPAQVAPAGVKTFCLWHAGDRIRLAGQEVVAGTQFEIAELRVSDYIMGQSLYSFIVDMNDGETRTSHNTSIHCRNAGAGPTETPVEQEVRELMKKFGRLELKP